MSSLINKNAIGIQSAALKEKLNKIADRPVYIFGRNIYARSIMEHMNVSGFIDDFTNEVSHNGLPILSTEHIPNNAMVIVASAGRPLSSISKLNKRGIEFIDYFNLSKYSGFPLTEILFNEGFCDEFDANEEKYTWAYNLMQDEGSKTLFKQLINFRYSYDLSNISTFSLREDEQYFESFLELNANNETFVDVGGYDGFTSIKFIEKCPNYSAIHIFEPDPDNFKKCEKNLASHSNVTIYPIGLSKTKTTFKIEQAGSASKISQQGSIVIDVDTLDNVFCNSRSPTYIKMDTEGAEADIIEGARETIIKYRPRLAVSAYHKVGDFWRIPEKVLSIRNDYKVYLRHYTESIYESVLYFV